MSVERLYRDYTPLAKSVASRMVHLHDIPFDQALDDAYWGLFLAARRADPSRPFGPYARKCIWGSIVQGVRDRCGTRMKDIDLEFVQIPDDLCDPSPSPHEALEADDLWRMVDQLPDRQAASIRLNFRMDVPQTDIAEMLGVSQMQVSRYITAGKESLREALAA